MLKLVKKNKKIIWIVIITVLAFVLISKMISSCSHSIVRDLSYDVEETKNAKKLSMHSKYEAGEVLSGIAKKNGDWSSYPLSKDFLTKYNSEDGIFPHYNFDYLDWTGMQINEYSDSIKTGYFTYSLYKYIDKEKHIVGPAWTVKIDYELNNKDEVNNIKIIEEKQVYDEEGYPIREWDKEFTYKNLYLISDPLFNDL